MSAPQLVTARAASGRTRVPWRTLRSLLEAAGYRIYRIAGRDRVAEADLAALIESSGQPTAAEAGDRVELAIALAAAEMGVVRRGRRGRAPTDPPCTSSAVRAGAPAREGDAGAEVDRGVSTSMACETSGDDHVVLS